MPRCECGCGRVAKKRFAHGHHRRKSLAPFIVAENGCWLWQRTTTHGYGHKPVNGRYVRAHRWAYELLVGPIPEGLELDHLCRDRACINPAHLEPVTRRENAKRGSAGLINAARQRAKTHCKNGHPFNEANTRVNRKGYRECRACAREKMQRRRSLGLA